MARADEAIDAFERMLVEAWIDLAHLVDRERSWLQAGSRSCMPAPIRNPITDYPGDDTPRRPPPGRDGMERLRVLFLGRPCLSQMIPLNRAKLFGTVLDVKAWPARHGRFLWQTVYDRMGGKRRKVPSINVLEADYVEELHLMHGRWALMQGLRERYEAEQRTSHRGEQAEVAAMAAADALADAIEQVRDARIRFAAGLIGRVELDQALARLDSAQVALAR